MSGARLLVSSGNYVTAQPFGIHDGVDYLHTGSVRDVHTDALHAQLEAGHLVLLPPLGYSLTGEVFNLPAEEVAMRTAIELGADKLILYIDKLPADQDGKAVRQASAQRFEMLAATQSSDALQRTMTHAVQAARQGVARVHLLESAKPDALLEELFTRDGSGTLITAEHWENIRGATIADVGGLIELITPLQENGALTTRSREQLELEIDHFVVSERDGMIIACAALFLDRDRPELRDAPHRDEPGGDPDHTAEIACVATHPQYRGGGRADQLIRFLEARARTAGCHQVRILSTRTGHWFIERGYREIPLDTLPAWRRAHYSHQRNSRIYLKDL